MTITAKVRKRMIENGRLVHAIVQGESNATTILFRIEGETDLVAEETLFLYLLYKRPNDQTVQLPILLDYTIEDGVILATFTPGAYFTADSGPVEISVIATSSAAVLGGSGEVTNTLLWSSFPAWLLVAPSQLADSSTIIEENVFTQYLAELEAESDEAKAYASDAEEFAKGTRSDGETVPHASSGSGDNAKAYKNLAKDWASKTNGTVEGGEMSAKYYAGTADSRAKEAEGYAVGTVSGTPSALFAGKNAKELASDAQDWAKGTRSDGKTPSHTSDSAKAYAESAAGSAAIVSAHATEIDAIGDDLAGANTIGTVAADLTGDDDIGTVASGIMNINTVAGDLTGDDKIGTVAADLSGSNTIGTVAGIYDKVTTVAGIDDEVTTVAGIYDKVTTVAGIYDKVTTVAGIDDEVVAVAGIQDKVTAVAAIDDEITTVADEDNLADIGTVATNIGNISDVADDLQNINDVAADLDNIDAADDHALEAEGWAVGTQNGVPVTSGSPYYENNAKYYGQEIPNLKDAIRKDEARITNLEEKADPTGAYKTVNYRGTDAVPTGKAKYALVESIVGKSRAWNQLFGDRNRDVWNVDGLDIVYNSTTKKYTFGGTYSGTGGKVWLDQNLNPQAHEYLIFSDNPLAKVYADSSSGYTNYAQAIKFTANAGWSGYYGIALEQGVTYTGSFAICMRDLTLIFPEGVPSTIAECVAKCPDLLKVDDRGTSIVNTTVEGVKSVGVNIWDEVWESGDISSSTGENVPSSSYIRGVNYYPCLPSTEYYGKAENKIYLLWYDNQKNYIGYTPNGFQNTYKESPVNAYYFRISINTTSYGNNVQICLNSYTNKTQYHPHMESTLSLPSSVTLRSAGSVADTCELNVEVNGVEKKSETERVGSFNGSAITFVRTTEQSMSLYSIRNTDCKPETFNIFNSFGLPVVRSFNSSTETEEKFQSPNIYGDIFILLKPSRVVADFDVNYELNTPVVTLSDPIINNTIQTEGGGTINTIQTQTPVIDNSMDVGYLAL